MEEKQLLIKALDRLEHGDVLGSAELLGECYSSEAEEALDILTEGDVDLELILKDGKKISYSDIIDGFLRKLKNQSRDILGRIKN